MAAADADALDCDFAEVYGIVDRSSLPPLKAAVLAGGLFSSEKIGRIRRKYAGARYSTDTLLLAAAADRLSTLVWFKTKDAQKKRNRPASILAELIDEKETKDTLAFDSAEEFEAEMARRRAAGNRE